MNENTTLNTYLFNVGHGDQILLELPDGTYGIIDSYYEPAINPVKEPPALTYLREIVNPTISFIIFTSYHYTHLRGLARWLAWFEKFDIVVKNVWLPGAPSLERISYDLHAFLNDKDAKSEFLKRRKDLRARLTKYIDGADSTIKKLQKLTEKSNVKRAVESKLIIKNEAIQIIEDESVSLAIYCIAPSDSRIDRFNQLSITQMLEYFLDEKDNDLHHNYDVSAITMMQYGPFSMIFGSDAVKENIEESVSLVNSGNIGTNLTFASDLIKVFNHGSPNVADSNIWQQAMKEVTYLGLSAGKEWRFKPPYTDLVQALKVASKKENKAFKLHATSHPSHDFDAPFAQLEEESEELWDYENLIMKIGSFEQTKSSSIDAFIPSPSEKVTEYDEKLHEKANFIGYRFEFDIQEDTTKVIGMVPFEK